MKKVSVLLLVMVLGASACSSEDEPKSTDLTKEEARDQGGTSDAGEDLCEKFGWYGDKICDDFCPEADADCDSANNGTTGNNGVNNGTTGNNGANNGTTGNNGTNNATNNGTSGTNNGTGGTNNNTNGPVSCGARAGDTCGDQEFCDFTELAMCGATDQQGVCTPRPDACPDNIDPVCGCNGMTYNNECEAQAAGTDALRSGACDASICQSDADCGRGESCVNGACEASTGGSCGGRTGVTCPADEYCRYDAADMCGAFDAPGVCSEPPQVCPTVYAPVCGCDQMTYGNDCLANAAGTSVFAQGECPTACQNNGDCDRGERCENGFCESLIGGGGVCGGIAGLTCGADEWCDYPDTSTCGAADQQGVCMTRPDACTAVYDPVCGCDGTTYGNACTAHAAGVDVMSDGVCP